jgi:outer membrane protein insertion porin family
VLTPAVVNPIFASQIGQAISPTALTQAVRQVNQWYANNGYKLARVLSVEPSDQGVLTIEVAEGYVKDVQIQFINAEGKTVDANGNPIKVRTQPGFVRDQIKLKPGQVFQESVVADDIRRLYGLGIFERVNVSFEGDARQTTVVYSLVEGKARGFNFGGGYNDDVGIYGTISYNDRNFGGLGQQLGGTVQVSGQDVLFEGNFRSPYRASTPEVPGYGAFIFRRRGLSRVFDEDIRLSNDDKVRERQFGGGIYAEKPLGPDWMGNLGLNYTHTRMTDKDGETFKKDEDGNPLSWSGKGYDDLTTISFSATRDRRDNPTNPSTGSILSFSTAQSIPIGTGNILNNTLQANYAQFFPVNLLTTPQSRLERGTQQPEVLAFNVQGGTVLGDLPPYNAFILGGADSVRGYDPGDVATSRSYFLLSAEYRFPIYKFIGGALFADFGSDLGSSDSVLGEPGVKRDKPGTGAGFGAGVRVNSPLGILRLDLGVNVEGDTKLQFGFGQKF